MVHDAALIGDLSSPVRLAASITVPTLLIHGAASPPWMQAGVRAIADVLPGARYRSLAGQTHEVMPSVLAPVLREFFTEPCGTRQNTRS